MGEFTPKVSGFCCLWCNFPIAGLTGDQQVEYESGLTVNVLSCLGKVEMSDLLKAFEEGSDGVFLIGCLEERCQHETGSLRARKRVERARDLLEEIGINKERIMIHNLPVDKVANIKEIVDEVKGKMRELGPM